MSITVRPFDGSSYSANVDPDSYHLSLTTQNNEQTEGVLLGWGGEFALSGTSSPITVASGRAFINGKEIISTDSEQVNIPTPSSATRVDVIALEVDYINKTSDAAIVRVAGTEGGGVPTVTWTPGTKVQLPVGQVSITTGGVCTCTSYSDRFLHFATKVSTDMLDDGVLSADAAGRAKMADGYLSADAAGRAKMADGFVNVDKLADSIDASAKAFNADKVDGYHASDIIGGGVIQGAIIMWYGSLGGSDGHRPVVGGTPNEDWHICNGETVGSMTTPDLRDRFIVGAGSSYALGQTGGNATQNLSHWHTVNTTTSYETGSTFRLFAGGETASFYAPHWHTVNANTSSTLGVTDFRPPYMALYYIMKVA